MLARMRDKLLNRPEVGAWARAAELIARPDQVAVGVEEVDDDPAAVALVARAMAILSAALGSKPNVFARALSALQVRESRSFGYQRLVAARFHAAPGEWPPLFVVAEEIAPLMAIPTVDTLVSERPDWPEAAVNIEHPHFRALLRLAGEQPELAGYGLAKALLLDADRGLGFDIDLIEAATGGWS